MNNLPTPPDRAKTVHNSRIVIFDYVANDDDDEERTARDEANDLEAIIAFLSSKVLTGRKRTPKATATSGTPSAATKKAMAGY